MANPALFTAAIRSRYPRRNLDYGSHRFRAGYVIPDRRPKGDGWVLELEAKPGVKVIFSDSRDPEIGRDPERRGRVSRPVEIKRLDLPDDVTSYEWHVELVGGGFSKDISRQVPKGSLPTPYVVRFELPQVGTYEITCRLVGKSRDYVYKDKIELRDYLIVSVGDSYASGQGNPDKPGEPAGFDPDIDWWDVFNPVKVSYELSKEALDWGWNRLKRDFTTVTLAAKATIDMDPPPEWFEAEADRSLISGPAIAARRLENLKEGVVITFLPFARTGSEIKNGLLGSRTSDGTPIDGWIGRIGQIEEVERTIEDRQIDALLISIGGNDVGFSGGLKDLIAGDLGPLILIAANDVQAREKVKRNIEEKMATLEGHFQELADAVSQLNVRDVYITEYPTAQFDLVINGEAKPSKGCGVFSTDFNANIDREDAELFHEAGVKLNLLIKQVAETHGWHYVDGIDERFRGGGYCSGRDERLFVQARESLIIQSDTNGTLHPNRRGHQIYAEQLAEAIEKHTITKKVRDKPQRPWLDSRIDMDDPEVTN